LWEKKSRRKGVGTCRKKLTVRVQKKIRGGGKGKKDFHSGTNEGGNRRKEVTSANEAQNWGEGKGFSGAIEKKYEQEEEEKKNSVRRKGGERGKTASKEKTSFFRTRKIPEEERWKST